MDKQIFSYNGILLSYENKWAMKPQKVTDENPCYWVKEASQKRLIWAVLSHNTSGTKCVDFFHIDRVSYNSVQF